MTNPNISTSIPVWSFWLPFLLQTILVLSVPVQAAYTYLSGKTVIVQTIPVDPYDLLRGYSQTLRYDISRYDTLKNLPGWETIEPLSDAGTSFYVTLEAPISTPSSGNRPPPWKPIAINRDRPTNLPANQVAIQGRKSSYSWVDYGLESYYFPEDQREEINTYINQTLQNSRGERPFVVEIKVDSQGKAIPVSLWVGDKKYQF